MDQIVQGIDYGITLKWTVFCCRFVKDAAERENIRPVVYFGVLALRLFGRHITHGPHHQAGRGMLLRHDCCRGLARLFQIGIQELVGLQKLHQAKIDNLGIAITRDHDVVRFQIPVHDPCCVCLRESFGNLREPGEKSLQVGLLLMNLLAQRFRRRRTPLL